MPWETREERIAKELKTIDSDIVDAVRGYLEDGESEEEIRKTLKEGPGFSDDEANEILSLAKQPKKENIIEKKDMDAERRIYKIVLAISALFFMVFLITKRGMWLFIGVACFSVLLLATGFFALKRAIRHSKDMADSISMQGEPLKVISPKKEWSSLIIVSLFFASFVGMILAVVIGPLLMAMNMPPAIVFKAMVFMIPLSLILFFAGISRKLAEYRFYKDSLIYHTHLILHGGCAIHYKNISSIKGAADRKAVAIIYRDEDGDVETLEIDCGDKTMDEAVEQLRELAGKRQ